MSGLSSTTFAPDQEPHKEYIEFGIYIVEGSLLFAVSFLVAFSLARTRQLAERYSLLIAQYCTNALMGFGKTLAGIVRIIMLASDYTELKSPRFCMLMPWNIIFTCIDSHGVWYRREEKDAMI
ncbi:hypothetical protein Tcan_06814 [Toxocara canis]|uniref:Uncharacterized protein n=1 Tax=Toxocara canis TaxID=6265 RepID=A0A0B2VXG6_TOXCA|nr:hypothetical protein Tcan_06814 [Toxocara canis]